MPECRDWNPFASGCKHADWLAGFCIMQEDGKPITDPNATDGRPLILGFSLPASAWEIEDTWHAAGLEGTGSHHIILEERVVSGANFFDLQHGTPCESGPLYQAPWHMLVMTTAAAAIRTSSMQPIILPMRFMRDLDCSKPVGLELPFDHISETQAGGPLIFCV